MIDGVKKAHAFMLAGSLFLSLSALSQEKPLSPEAKKVKASLQASLVGGWSVTDFEIEDLHSSYVPWSHFFPDARMGYSATLEDLGRTVSEPGGKRGAALSERHPRFDLWLLSRSRTINPQSFSAMFASMDPIIQEAHPVAMGYNPDFIVACVYDCSTDNPQMQALLKSLHLQPVPTPVR